MEGCEPVQLTMDQRARAAVLLAEAFHDDPTYRFVLPDETRRRRVLVWLFDRVVQYSLLYGAAHTTPSVEGVACWLPPGGTHVGLGRLIRSGLYGTPLKMGPAAYRRFSLYRSYAEGFHERLAPDSHWYLWAVGVSPPSQGRGIGGMLIEAVVAGAGADGKVCYLETGAERNVRFYEKHGFRVVGEGEVPGTGLKVWAMLRNGAAG